MTRCEVSLDYAKTDNPYFKCVEHYAEMFYETENTSGKMNEGGSS